MTLEPVVFHLGPLEIAGFGLMMMLAFIVGGWLGGRVLRERGLHEGYAGDLVVAAVVGGILGAKLWYVILKGDPSALFSRAGLVYYGGFLGGTAGVILTSLYRTVPIRWTAHVVAAPLAAAYAIGRIGCLLANDDYGMPIVDEQGWPRETWYGVRFPKGLPPTTAAVMAREFGYRIPDGMDPSTVLPVYPTQVFETLLMGGAFVLLWRLRRAERPIGWLFAVYLMLAGLERFVVEILRAKDDRFLGVFTLAQLTSAGLVAVGALLCVQWGRGASPDPGPFLRSGPPTT